MIGGTKRRFAPIIAAFFLLGAPLACAPMDPDCVPTRIEDDQSGALLWSGCIPWAETEQERAEGLMGHAPLEPGEGLLLFFPVEDEICIHNQGVAFPLDVIFINDERTVVEVVRDLPAQAVDAHCFAPTRYVLEISAGQAHDIEIGDQLNFESSE